MMLNLLMNAQEAVSALETRSIRIDVQDLGANVVISVTDNGHGIAPEIRSRILTPKVAYCYGAFTSTVTDVTF